MSQRIWIYTLSKQLSEEQLLDFKNRCNAFVLNWTAHDTQLAATYKLYKNRLLIFEVDETVYNASGCSIDKQTRFAKELEQLFNIELLNRLNIAYQKENEIVVVAQNKIKELLLNNSISESTLIYNNTISNSLQLETEWLKPLKETWLNKYLTN